VSHDAGAARLGRRVRRTSTGFAISGCLLLGACGIPTDSEPRAIPREAVPEPAKEPARLATTTLDPTDPTTQAQTVFLVQTGEATGTRGERLEPVAIDVPTPADPDDLPRVLLERLARITPAEVGRPGLQNAVPSETRVLDATLTADGVLEVNLANLEQNIESALQRLAIAQIVFTATELTALPVRAVRFSVEGQPVAVPTEGGSSEPGQPVTRTDYPTLAAQLASTDTQLGTG